MEELIHFKIATVEDKEVFIVLLKEKLQSLKDQGNIIAKEFNNVKTICARDEAIFDQIVEDKIKGVVTIAYDKDTPIGFNLIGDQTNLMGKRGAIAVMYNSYIKRKYRKSKIFHQLHEFSLEQIKDDFELIMSAYNPEKDDLAELYKNFKYNIHEVVAIKNLKE